MLFLWQYSLHLAVYKWSTDTLHLQLYSIFLFWRSIEWHVMGWLGLEGPQRAPTLCQTAADRVLASCPSSTGHICKASSKSPFLEAVRGPAPTELSNTGKSASSMLKYSSKRKKQPFTTGPQNTGTFCCWTSDLGKPCILSHGEEPNLFVTTDCQKITRNLYLSRTLTPQHLPIQHDTIPQTISALQIHTNKKSAAPRLQDHQAPGKAKTGIPGSAQYQQRYSFVVSLARQFLLLIQQKSSLPHRFFCSYYLSPWMPPSLLRSAASPPQCLASTRHAALQGSLRGAPAAAHEQQGAPPHKVQEHPSQKKWFKRDTSG